MNNEYENELEKNELKPYSHNKYLKSRAIEWTGVDLYW